MDLSLVKTRTELVREIIDYISSRFPTADLSPGTVLRDLLVEGPMTYLASTSLMTQLLGELLDLNELSDLLENYNTKIEYSQALNIQPDEFDTILRNVVELYASNFNMSRKLGSASTGALLFYSVTKPTQTYNIPAGTKLVIPDTGITFRVLTAATLESTSSYDSFNNRYYTTTDGVCDIIGGVGNVPANTITEYSATHISGVSAINPNAFRGGVDIEDDSALLNRVKLAYTGNFQGTAPSILANIFSISGVKDVRLAYELDDPNRVRDSLGAIDAFVYGSSLAVVNDTPITVASTGMITLPNSYVSVVSEAVNQTYAYSYPTNAYSVSYDEDGVSYVSFEAIGGAYIETFPETNESGITINLRLNPGVTPAIYGSFPDADGPLTVNSRTQVYKTTGSIRVNDTPNWTLTTDPATGVGTLQNHSGVTSVGTSTYDVKLGAIAGDIINFDYSYDEILTDVQTKLNDTNNVFVGQDTRVFPATAVPIYVDITVQVDPAYSTADRAGACRAKLYELIGKYGLGAEINQSYILTEFLKISGVVDVELPFRIFTKDSTTKTGSSDILLGSLEYPVFFAAIDVIIRGTHNRVSN